MNMAKQVSFLGKMVIYFFIVLFFVSCSIFRWQSYGQIDYTYKWGNIVLVPPYNHKYYIEEDNQFSTRLGKFWGTAVITAANDQEIRSGNVGIFFKPRSYPYKYQAVLDQNRYGTNLFVSKGRVQFSYYNPTGFFEKILYEKWLEEKAFLYYPTDSFFSILYIDSTNIKKMERLLGFSVSYITTDMQQEFVSEVGQGEAINILRDKDDGKLYRYWLDLQVQLHLFEGAEKKADSLVLAEKTKEASGLIDDLLNANKNVRHIVFYYFDSTAELPVYTFRYDKKKTQ